MDNNLPRDNIGLVRELQELHAQWRLGEKYGGAKRQESLFVANVCEHFPSIAQALLDCEKAMQEASDWIGDEGGEAKTCLDAALSRLHSPLVP